MTQKITDLRCREVINIHTGLRLGYVYDVQLNIETGQIVSLIILAQGKLFGLIGRREDIIIPWECVRRVGDDIILIDAPETGGSRDYGEPRRVRRRYW